MLSVLSGFLVATVIYGSSTMMTNDYARQRVWEELYDTPALIDVAFCESTFQMYEGTSTEVKRGRVDRRDVGLFQINEYYNGETARKLGYDIYTIDGNISMAKYLYKKNGLRDWSASFACLDERSRSGESGHIDI